jgi:hypothetical protein
MFSLSDKLAQKISEMLALCEKQPIPAMAAASDNIYSSCNDCTGNCKGSCKGGCQAVFF